MKTLYISIFLVFLVGTQCQGEKSDSITVLKQNDISTVAPKSTVKPNLNEIPEVLSGSINNTKNETCLRYHFGISINLDTDKNETESIKIPSDSHVDSDNCTSNKFEKFGFLFQNNSLYLTFIKNDTSIYLANINATIHALNKTLWLNASNPNPNFLVDTLHSYACENIIIKINQSEIVFSDIVIQAFMDPSKNGVFSKEHNCQNEINDVVPIAVGAALTILVIIVMIAYFIGRQHNHRSAYQSV